MIKSYRPGFYFETTLNCDEKNIIATLGSMGVRNSKIVGGGSIVLFDNKNGFD